MYQPKHSNYSPDPLNKMQQPLQSERAHLEELLQKRQYRTVQMERYSVKTKKSLEKSFTDELEYLPAIQESYCWPKFLKWLGEICTPFKILCPCLCCECCICQNNPLFYQQVKSVGILQEWGRYKKKLIPGLHVINPICEGIIQINQQTKLLIYQQILITRDNIQFKATIGIFYRVIEPVKTVYRLGVTDIQSCLREVGCGVFRNVVGQKQLQDIVENRTIVTQLFTQRMNKILNQWGLFVQVASLKQMIIDQQIMNTLSKLTQTRRQSEALLINFRAQVECAKLIKEMSHIINNQASFQIRYLNTVEQILNNGKDHTLIINTKQNINLS